MLHIKETIVVEGKFDKEQLKKITDAPIICTGGFSLYTNKNIINSIRSMAKKTGIIILTDSDSAGFRIRNYIKQCVGKNGTVKHAYIPDIEGKEKRKAVAGKEGLIGVEGMTEDLLKQVLKTVTETVGRPPCKEKPITKTTLFEDGLSGGASSSQKRQRLSKILGLPMRISTNSLLEILNGAFGYNEYKKALEKIEK
jgi:ribonuclease M5